MVHLRTGCAQRVLSARTRSARAEGQLVAVAVLLICRQRPVGERVRCFTLEDGRMINVVIGRHCSRACAADLDVTAAAGACRSGEDKP